MSYRTLTTMKPLNTSIQVLLKKGAYVGLGLGAFTPMLALANPTGGTVVAGTATIKNSNANTTVVKQSSQSAIIDWQQFNIGKGQYVQFLQPSSSSIILNRVIGGGGSSIFGTLTGNGQVFLVNTNGVFFGKGSSIDAQGFLASTLDIADSDFLSGHLIFNKTGGDATVVNQGTITAHKGGYVVLAGDYTENDGLISAQSGHIVLASGSKSTLTLNGNSLVSYAINQATLSQLAGVNNAGKLNADGGTVIMTADVANLLKATVVNNTGLIEARAISKNGGVIQLLASGGNIVNAGTLDASAAHAGQQGGAITLKGDERTTLTGTSKIFATGDGANGGHVEVSGDTLSMRGAMTLGQGGNLLLDPAHLELVATGGTGETGAGITSADGKAITTVGVDFIQTQLNAGVGVDISALGLIDASSLVTDITATGKGALSFKVQQNSGGRINLSGVDITIAGKLTASMGYGTFGRITAGTASLHAHSFISLDRATSDGHGKITHYSAKTTTGKLTIDASQLNTHGSAEEGLALDAVKGSLQVSAGIGTLASPFASDVRLVAGKSLDIKDVSITGQFTAVASNGYAHFGDIHAGAISIKATTKTAGNDLKVGHLQAIGGSIVLKDTGGDIAEDGDGIIGAATSISLTANHILDSGSGSLALGASTDITLNGILGATTAEGLGAVLALSAPHIKVNHSIKARNVFIQGSDLAYTGTGKTFAITASNSALILETAIGTALAPVKYNVKLTTDGRELLIGRSIYTGNTTGKAKLAANITATEIDTAAGTSTRGVIVGDNAGQPVTLSAKGSITLTGEAVGIGSVFGGSSSFGAITLKAGKNVSMTATGHGVAPLSGGVLIEAPHSLNDLISLDRPVLIQAAGNIVLDAKSGVVVRGGSAAVHFGSQDSIDTDLSVTLKAAGNISLTGGEDIIIAGGDSNVLPDASGSVTRTIDVDGSVNLIAGKAVTLAAGRVSVLGGQAGVLHGVVKGGADIGVSIDEDVNITAGTTLTATAASSTGLVIAGGASPGSGAAMDVEGSHSRLIADAHADVNLKAGTLKLTGELVSIAGGDFIHTSHSTPLSAEALGTDATAQLEGTADVNLTAGAGGITITAAGGPTEVTLRGGANLARGAEAFANGSGASASIDLESQVSLVTTGALSITGGTVTVAGGQSTTVAARAQALPGTEAELSAKSGVSLQGDSLKLTSTTGNLSIHAGDFTALLGLASAGSRATAVLSASAGVSLAATKGNLTIKAAHIAVKGGSQTAAGNPGASSSTRQLISGSLYEVTTHSKVDRPAAAVATGFGATATLTGKAGVSLSATGNVTMSQSSHAGGNSLGIDGGVSAGAHASVAATGGGTAKLTAQSGITVKAGGTVAFTVHSFNVEPGLKAGDGQSASIITHTHELCFSGASAPCAPMSAGTNTPGHQAGVSAKGTHSKALSSADAAIVIQGANVTIKTAQQRMNGVEAASLAAITASDGGSAAALIQNGIQVKATKAFTDVVTGNVDQIDGAASEGRKAQITATGQGAKASLQMDDQLIITAGTLSLSATHTSLDINGANAALALGVVDASHSGTAQVDVEDGILMSATGAFTAKAGDLSWLGSVAAGGQASVDANGGKAAIDLGTGIHVSGKTVQLSAGSIRLAAGEAAGTVATVTGEGGGSALMKVEGGLDFTAATAFGAKVTGTFSMLGARSVGNRVTVLGDAGKASLDIEGKVAIVVIQKSGTLAVQAGKLDIGFVRSGSFSSHFLGGGAARHADVTADSDGDAHLATDTGITMTALGAVKLSATTALSMMASPHGDASLMELSASGARAHASADVDNTINITGGSLTVSSSRSIQLVAAFGHSFAGGVHDLGHGMSVLATDGGSAAATLDDHVTLTATTGALTVAAGNGTGTGNSLKIGPAFGGGSLMQVLAQGGQAKATLDEGVTLDGATAVTLTASVIAAGETEFSGAIFKQARVTATDGTAAISADLGIHVATKGAFTAKAGNSLELAGFVGAIGASAAIHAGDLGHAGLVVLGNFDVDAQDVTLMGIHGVTVLGGREGGAHILVTTDGSGSASAQIQDGAAIQASKAMTITAGASASVIIEGGLGAASHAVVTASIGKAKLDVESNVTLQAATVTLTAGSFVTLEGGGHVGQSGHLGGFTGGSESFTAHAGVKVLTTGALSVKAGANILLTANSSGGSGTLGGNFLEFLGSGGGGNHAKADLGDALDIEVGSATLKASGQVALVGNFHAAESASVDAGENGDSAAFTADSRVDLDAKGAISITAANAVFSGGGSGGQMGLHATHANAHLAVSVDSGVGVNAGGALTVKAGSILIGGGSNVGAALAVAAGTSAASSHDVSAKADIFGGVDIYAASITLTATGSLILTGGGGAGQSVQVVARHGGAQVKISSGVTLEATGAMTLTAGSLSIEGDGVPFGQAPDVEAHDTGIASLQLDASVGLDAATVALKTSGSIHIFGGSQMKAQLNANGGTASAQLHGGVGITATKTLTMTAGGDLIVHGGSDLQIKEQVGGLGGTSHSSAIPAGSGAGKTTATADVGVDLQAGTDMTLKATGDVSVYAGDTLLLAVGAYAQHGSAGVEFIGNLWAGGTANITADDHAGLTAGHNLSITAGGQLLVQGAGPATSASIGTELLSVRGGSSHAVGSVQFNGKATLTAGNDLTLAAKGGIQVTGGSGFSLDLAHTQGHVIAGASLGASVHATHDVVLSSAGAASVAAASLVVSGGRDISLVDDVVSGLGSGQILANGGIVAGNDIRTVKAMSGALDVVRGGSVAISADAQNQSGAVLGAGVAADGILSAGRNITLSAAGDINLAGLGSATLLLTASHTSKGRYAISAQETVDVSAGGALTLVTPGHLNISGAVSGVADVLAHDGQSDTINDSLDGSTSIKVGSLNLTVGALVMKGGVGDVHDHASSMHNVDLSTTADESVSFDISGNATLTVGKITGLGASILAGGGVASLNAPMSDGKVAIVQDEGIHIDVSGNLGLTVGGDVTVRGGDGEAFGAVSVVDGSSDTVDEQANARVDIVAGGNLSIVVKKGSTITLAGGSDVGGNAVLRTTASGAFHPDQLNVDVDSGVSLTAGGALNLSGAGTVAITAGSFPLPANQPQLLPGNGPVTAVFLSDVVLSGKTVNLNNNVGVTTTSFGTDVTGPLIQQSIVTVKVTAAATTAFAPESTVSGLDTLGSQGLPVQLETVLGPAISLAAPGTVFSPSSSVLSGSGPFPASCATLLLKAEAAQRCTVGGR
jgi:filamentous hemagglutinin family protein